MLLVSNELVELTVPYPTPSDLFAINHSTTNQASTHYYQLSGATVTNNITVTIKSGLARLDSVYPQIGSDDFVSTLLFDKYTVKAYIVTEGDDFSETLLLDAGTVTCNSTAGGVTATIDIGTLCQIDYDNSDITKLAPHVRHSVLVVVGQADATRMSSASTISKTADKYPGWVVASKVHTGLQVSSDDNDNKIATVFNNVDRKDLRLTGGVIDLYNTFTVARMNNGDTMDDQYVATIQEVKVSGDLAATVTANFKAMSGVTDCFVTGGRFPIVGCYYKSDGTLRSKTELSTFLINEAPKVYTTNELRSRLGFKLPGNGNNGGDAYNETFTAKLSSGSGDDMFGATANLAGTGVFNPYFMDAQGAKLLSFGAEILSANQSASTVTFSDTSTKNANDYVGYTLTVVDKSNSTSSNSRANKFMRTVAASTTDTVNQITTLTLLGGWENSGNATNGYYITTNDYVWMQPTRDGYDPATDKYRTSWEFNENIEKYTARAEGNTSTYVTENVQLVILIEDYLGTSKERSYENVRFSGVADEWTLSCNSSFGTRSASFGQNMESTFLNSIHFLSNRYLRSLTGVTPLYNESYFRSFSQTKEENRTFADKALVTFGGPSGGSVLRVFGVTDPSILSVSNFPTLRTALANLGGTNDPTGDFSTKTVGQAMGTSDLLSKVHPTDDLVVTVNMIPDVNDNTPVFFNTSSGSATSDANGMITGLPGAGGDDANGDATAASGNFNITVTLADKCVDAAGFTTTDTMDANGKPTGAYLIFMRGLTDSSNNYFRVAMITVGGVQTCAPLELNNTESLADRAVFNAIANPTLDALFTAPNYDVQLMTRVAKWNDSTPFTPNSLFQLADSATNQSLANVKTFLSKAVPMRVSAEGPFPTSFSGSNTTDQLMEYMYRLRVARDLTGLTGTVEDTLQAGLTDGTGDADGYVQSPIFKGFTTEAFRAALAKATQHGIVHNLNGQVTSMRLDHNAGDQHLMDIEEWDHNSNIGVTTKNLANFRNDDGINTTSIL